MDAGLRLERVLRHLKNAEPEMDHWQSFGNVGRPTEVDGVLLNAGSFNLDGRRMLDGLVLAVSLLAKKCAAGGDGAQSRWPETHE
ncbi:MAG TPA: hypothetical protein VEV41_14405 [Terriglobales bacterium]|nr:hypothetical protein [Terriglobales bacterium]